MDLPNILNNKGPAAAAAAAAAAAGQQQMEQHYVQSGHMNGSSTSEACSQRGMSPHISDHSSFPPRSSQPLHAISNMMNAPRFDSPPQIPQPLSMLPGPYLVQNGGVENGFRHHHHQNKEENGLQNDNGRPTDGAGAVKAFACSTCRKAFARRSDLARHERIHSGIRPHICDHPGCNKQFIQRSALTVHARVHTGEKPHMCEHCTKPFSDSSSLARHRRIHSGKRPYKCPFADCQKTFTRRTTLTRHQNHHTGTVEESEAAKQAALASRPSGRPQRTRSDGGTFSDTGSPHTTPSPGERNLSLSPSSEVPALSLLARSHNDFSYMQSGSLPPHMRGDLMQQQSPRSSPTSTSPSLSAFGGSHHRPSMTSHPSMYGPPPTLEPPTHHEHRPPGSLNGSPHLSSMGWQSPTATAIGSPGHGDNNYIYPEPPYGAPSAHPLYYPNSNMRRPQSTEPDQYETKPRLVSGEVWATHM